MSCVHRLAAPKAPPLSFCAFLLASFASTLFAGVKEDVGLVTLQAHMGNVPSGVGVRVAMTEALVNGGYTPMRDLPEFDGKHIEFRSGEGNSAHATFVAQYFFGLTTSIAPGINTIEVYEANDYMYGGLLNASSPGQIPRASPQNSRVGNHSWISVGSTINGTLDVLERLDWLIEHDDYIQIVGVNNGDLNTSPLMSNAFNAIAVGRSDGWHAIQSAQVGGIYTHYRTRPEIVAPLGAASWATPVVAAASALLVDAGHSRPYLSNGSYASSRFPGNTIYHAETSEVVKATLMAGASRLAFNSTDGSALTDYRAASIRQSTNGLDKRYGAGQLNVNNSFAILTAGEQDSYADGRAFDVLPSGFDYDPQFGGAGGSNSSGTYDFTAGWTGQTLTASLVWNAKIDINQVRQQNYTAAATLYDLNLSLYDITSGTPALVMSSESSNQNTENLWTSLVGGRRYRMEVSTDSAQAPFTSDYALAWSTVGTIGWRGTGVWDNGWSPSWIKGNWAAGFSPGEHVVFNDSGWNGQVVIVGSVAPGSVLVDNSLVQYTFQGDAITGATGLIKRGSGQLALANHNTYTGSTIVEGGLLRVTGSITSPKPVTVAAQAMFAVDGNAFVGGIGGAGSTFVGNGFMPAVLTTSNIRQRDLIISTGGQVNTWAGGGTSVLGSLSIGGAPSAPSARFDLNNNAAVVDYTFTSPVADIQQQIRAGRGGPGFGANWSGAGINSTAAAAANRTAPESRSIGFAENALLPLGAYTSFRGQPVDGTSVLIAYTCTGDANLDGIVNDDDVTILGAMYAPGYPNAMWAMGDFDYNGFVDDDDVTLLGAFYDPLAVAVTAAPDDSTAFSATAAAVPEPEAATLLVAGVAACLVAALLRAKQSPIDRGIYAAR